MPHIHIDYSANLEQIIDFSHFVENLRKEALQIDAFPMAGIRVRAIRVDHYAIADGNPAHGYIDISVRLREGRSFKVKKAAIEQLFDHAKAYLEPMMTEHPIALSAEIRDIDAQLSPKFGTIRDHLKDLS